MNRNIGVTGLEYGIQHQVAKRRLGAIPMWKWRLQYNAHFFGQPLRGHGLGLLRNSHHGWHWVDRVAFVDRTGLDPLRREDSALDYFARRTIDHKVDTTEGTRAL